MLLLFRIAAALQLSLLKQPYRDFMRSMRFMLLPSYLQLEPKAPHEPEIVTSLSLRSSAHARPDSKHARDADWIGACAPHLWFYLGAVQVRAQSKAGPALLPASCTRGISAVAMLLGALPPERSSGTSCTCTGP